MTERREMGPAQDEREQFLSELESLAGIGRWTWDVAADRVTWSDELYRIYGLDRDTFGASFAAYLERVHPDDRDRARSEVEAAYREARGFDFEERIVRPDGTIRVLRSRGRCTRNEAGAVSGLVGACLDITALRHAQEQAVAYAREHGAREAAEAAATRLRFLAEASELLATSLDYEATLRTVAWLAVPQFADWCAVDLLLDDGSLQRVAVAHPDATRVELAKQVAARYPPQRGSGRGAWHVIDTGQTDYYPEIPDELLLRAAQDEEHLRSLRALGLRSAVAVPLNGRDGTLGALTLVQAESGRLISADDVAIARELGRHAGLAIENARLHFELEQRTRLLEEQSIELEHQAEELQQHALQGEELMARLESANRELVQRAAEAEAANRAKSQFLATMSHELRTPLNAIFGYADLIDLGLHGPVTPAQRDAIDRIKRNQRALLALINDVLNFAKLEAGQLEFDMTSVPIEAVIAELDKIVRPQMDAKHLHFVCQPGNSAVHVHGDHERMEQILLNLLTNAIKYTPADGSITLSVEADATSVQLIVSDTGRGIPEDRLDAIFDPFVQIDRQTRDSSEHGVGLGLAISRDLAIRMHGTLTVRSRLGHGATFVLTLPRSPDVGPRS